MHGDDKQKGAMTAYIRSHGTGCPRKSTFLEFQVLDHFGRLWTILAFLNHWGPFGQFWAIWDHFDCFDHFGLCGQFWTVTNHAGAIGRSKTVQNGPQRSKTRKFRGCFFLGHPVWAKPV